MEWIAQHSTASFTKKCTQANILYVSKVVTSVTIIVNILKGRNAQRHGKFIEFSEDFKAEYEDAPLFSKIPWLSAGKTLKHFFVKIPNFIQINTRDTRKIPHSVK